MLMWMVPFLKLFPFACGFIYVAVDRWLVLNLSCDPAQFTCYLNNGFVAFLGFSTYMFMITAEKIKKDFILSLPNFMNFSCFIALLT